MCGRLGLHVDPKASSGRMFLANVSEVRNMTPILTGGTNKHKNSSMDRLYSTLGTSRAYDASSIRTCGTK